MATRHTQQYRYDLIGPAPQDDEERDQAGQRQHGGPDEEEE